MVKTPLPYPSMTVDDISRLPVRDLCNAETGAHLYLWSPARYLHEALHVVEAWGFQFSAPLVWCKSSGLLGGTFPSNVEFVLFCRRRKTALRPDYLPVTNWIARAVRASGVRMGDIDREFGFTRSNGSPSQMSWHWVTSDPRQAQVPSVSQFERLKSLLGAGDEMDSEVRRLNDQKGAPIEEPIARARSRWFTWPVSKTHSRKPDAFFDLVEQVSPGPYCELFARRNRLGWATWGDEALEHVSLGGVAG